MFVGALERNCSLMLNLTSGPESLVPVVVGSQCRVKPSKVEDEGLVPPMVAKRYTGQEVGW